MSKRTRPKSISKAASAPGPSDSPPSLGAEVLRRMLLVIITALIAARPFVRAEDPGLLSDFSDPGAMVLTFLALAGCAGWAVWRLWSPTKGGVYLGAVEIGLFLLAVLFFAGASIAPYSRAAYLTAAEWLGLALLLFLVRQLAVQPGDQQGLMAVLLATTVALSAQGIYQVAREIPRTVNAPDTTKEESEKDGESGLSAVGTEPRVEKDKMKQVIDRYSRVRIAQPTRLEEAQIRDQLENRKASGVFFHPSSLAACLVLLLPLMGGALVAAVKEKLPRSVTGGVLVSLLLGCITLAMTRDAVAACALAFIGFPALGMLAPARFGGSRTGAFLGLLAASGLLAFFYYSGRLSSDIGLWREAWPATWQIVDGHFWRGIGPAQFRFVYPRFMPETALHKLADAPSSLLGVMADVGIGGALMLALMLVALLAAVWRWWHSRAVSEQRPAVSEQSPGVQTSPAVGVRPSTPEAASGGDASLGELRWEFYLGGMFAAIIAFTLQAGSNSTVDVLDAAIVAAVRSVVWFFALALFERLSWTPREFVASLLVGVLGVALFFCVRPGLSFPAVAALLWVAVALLLAIVRPAPVAWPGKSETVKSVVALVFAPRTISALLLPVFVAGSFGYFALVLFPAAKSATTVTEARLAGSTFQVDALKKPTDQKIKQPLAYIDNQILKPLLVANREDGDNPRTLRLLAQWTLQRWAIAPSDESNQGSVTRDRTGETRYPSMDERARLWAEAAQNANPQDPTNYRAVYEIHDGRCQVLTRQANMLEERNKKDEKAKKDKKLPPAQRDENRRMAAAMRTEIRVRSSVAAKVIESSLPHDPSNPTLYFLLARSRFESGDRTGAREAGEKALRLDRAIRDAAEEAVRQGRAVGSPRSLTDPQRGEMGKWLIPESPPRGLREQER